MYKDVEQRIWESRHIYEAAKKYKENLSTHGIDDNYLADFDGAINQADDGRKKYASVSSEIQELTKKQNYLMDEIQNNIGIIKSIAKYRIKDSEISNKLRVGIKNPTTVSKLLGEAGIVLSAATEFKSILEQNGAKTAIENLDNFYKQLLETDNAQEKRKKESKPARELRDEKIENMLDMAKLIQKIAGNVFKKNPSIQDEFFNFVLDRTRKEAANPSENK